jgi:hypothetical protein
MLVTLFQTAYLADKFVPAKVMKAYGKVKVELNLFFISAVDCSSQLFAPIIVRQERFRDTYQIES